MADPSLLAIACGARSLIDRFDAVLDQYLEREDSGAYIEATLFVERESHKGIVIGQNGSMLKRIGTTARLAFETASGRKVFLRLRVKVRKNWRNDEKVLRSFGY